MRKSNRIFKACLVTTCLLAGASAAWGQHREPQQADVDRRDRKVAPSKAEDDTTPSGMVAFFMAAACPSGWIVPPDVQGRLILSVASGANVGVKVGTPLSNQTAPVHAHAYSTTLNLPAKPIAADTCCNNSGASNQNDQNPPGYPISGSVSPASSNLPFVQLVVCQKN